MFAIGPHPGSQTEDRANMCAEEQHLNTSYNTESHINKYIDLLCWLK